MSGRHTKPARWSRNIAGSLIAGVAISATFAISANASDVPDGFPEAKAAAAKIPGVPAPAPTATAKVPAPATAPQVAAAGKGPAADAPKAAPVTAQQVIEKAKTQIGEKEGSGGATKYGEWYSATERAAETIARDGGDRKGYIDAQWCAMFVSWVGNQLGINDKIGEDAWTVAHAQWFKDKGKWGTTPKPGAVVFFNWSGSKSIDSVQHVGIVTDAKNGKVQTIEGNTSGNRVEAKERSTSQIVGYGYPDYAG